MIVIDYTDGFPWLKWSRHFTGETSVQVKIIEPYNLLRYSINSCSLVRQ